MSAARTRNPQSRENEVRESETKENPMFNSRTLLASALFIALFSSLGIAQNLGKYRDFQFGTNVESLAKQIQVKASAAQTSHQRPALIQTLQWNPTSYSAPATAASVRSIRFDFYNDELFKMFVTYNSAGTAGLTADDIIEAISALYGTAAKPDDSVTISNATNYRDQEKVLARWEDAQYSYNFFRFSYGTEFGLVAFSKTLDVLADTANREADRLDALEAPAKEVARQKKQVDDARTAQESARAVNKPKFLP
jgi:hypothetical protein